LSDFHFAPLRSPEGQVDHARDSRSLASDRDRHVLIVDDDIDFQMNVRLAMGRKYDVRMAHSLESVRLSMAQMVPGIVILDLELVDGSAVLAEILELHPQTKVLVTSGVVGRRDAAAAIANGAYDYFSKPLNIDALRIIVGRASRLYALEQDNIRLARAAAIRLDEVITNESSMMDICALLQKAASTDMSVLIIGESGVGKDVLARAVHGFSLRKSGPFIAINCGAVPEDLFEKELFGHERGAFTGAVTQSRGKIEQAAGGTLYLDEIGDMPLALQAKLLRFLQERTFQRVGGHENMLADVRIVAASNRDLTALISTGKFREDLYFRLNEIEATVPPLRERGNDAVLISSVFVKKLAQVHNKGDIELSPDARAVISYYNWPGNVRELENRIKRGVVLAQGPEITPADLGFHDGFDGDGAWTLREARRRAEMAAIIQALAACEYNVARAAKSLGVSRPTLYDLIGTYKIRMPKRAGAIENRTA